MEHHTQWFTQHIQNTQCHPLRQDTTIFPQTITKNIVEIRGCATPLQKERDEHPHYLCYIYERRWNHNNSLHMCYQNRVTPFNQRVTYMRRIIHNTTIQYTSRFIKNKSTIEFKGNRSHSCGFYKPRFIEENPQEQKLKKPSNNTNHNVY